MITKYKATEISLSPCILRLHDTLITQNIRQFFS